MSLFEFLRPIEAQLIRDLADLIKVQFGEVRFLEIGVLGGDTTRGLYDHCAKNGIPLRMTGVDIDECPNPIPAPDYEFIQGDSMDMHRKITRRDYNLLFIDGCHCCNHSTTDFLNYSPFLQVGGHLVFHDTALPKGEEVQGEWPQNHGYAGRPSGVLGVREGLRKTGLLQGYRSDWRLVKELESDSGLMGICLFQKVLDL